MTSKWEEFYTERFSMHVDDIFEDFVEAYGIKNIVPITALVFYLFVIFVLPHIIIAIDPSHATKKKVSKPLRMICFLWNVVLSVFSLVSFIAVIIPLGRLVSEHGVVDLLCDEGGNLITNRRLPIHFFYSLFLLSKFVELGDTFFLILKKPLRRPSFLHCYHHITVMVSCWYLAVTNVSVAHYGIPVNLFIHTIMYGYYALYEIGYKPTWGIILTVLQMLQMVLGIVAWGMWAYMRFGLGRPCAGKKYLRTVMYVGFVMYGTYLYLFFRFFMNRYFPSKKKSQKEEEKKKEI